ncbi:hypothetical protein HF521_014618 [Silurus meridionalis]|uniref:Major facilitator superfamily (MFS) profile domain-containing protein n=1 Tax=Silurus meridionalis TaxID=175797 RepID=A0A8T0AA77_SILME|nr:hypothetical protein HF521_014618 [Silurus meridionalis]
MNEDSLEIPDGGYGWVVVLSAFFSRGLTTAVLKNFGLFFLEIQNYYNVLTSTVSWVTSISIAMFHLGAPLAGGLGVYVTQRGVMMIGGVLAVSGMIFASLNLGLPWLYLSLGVLQETKEVTCKRFVRPLICSNLLSGMYSVIINLLVCGVLMKPLKPQASSQTPTLMVVSTSKNIRCSLIQRPELLLYIAFAILAAFGFFIPPLFLVPYGNHKGIEQYWAAILLSILSLADLLGRLACGWLILAVASVLLGVVVLLLPLPHAYWPVVAFTTLYGFLFGCVVAVHITSIVDIVGLECFDSALGLFMLLRTIGAFIAPPASGWLVDWTGEFSTAFYPAGLCFILSAVFVVMVDRLVVRKNNDLVKVADAAADSETGQIKGIDHLEL